MATFSWISMSGHCILSYVSATLWNYMWKHLVDRLPCLWGKLFLSRIRHYDNVYPVMCHTSVLFQYYVSRLVVGSCKVSNPRDLCLKLSDRYEISQAPRQHLNGKITSIASPFEYSRPCALNFKIRMFIEYVIYVMNRNIKISNIKTDARCW